MHNSTGNGITVLGSGSTLRLQRSTISSNGGITNRGGGIYSQGQAYISNSTISGNTARDGGGVYLASSGVLSIRNSTVTRNFANQNGGAIRFNSLTQLVDNIISGNNANISAHEISRGNGTFTSRNNLFGDNTSTQAEAFSNFTLGGTDLDGTVDGLGIRSFFLLNNLDDNGGPTLTHNLRLTSFPENVVINRVASGECAPDQRNAPRGDVSSGCDLGAVEFLPRNGNLTVHTIRDLSLIHI